MYLLYIITNCTSQKNNLNIKYKLYTVLSATKQYTFMFKSVEVFKHNKK